MDNKPFFLMTTTSGEHIKGIKEDLVRIFGLDIFIEWVLLHDGDDISDAFAVALPSPEEFPCYLQAAKDFAHHYEQEAFYFIDADKQLTAFNERGGIYEPEYGFNFRNVGIADAQKRREYIIHRGGDETTYWVID